MANKAKAAARAERAAALLAEQKAKQRKRNIVTAVSVAGVLAVLVAAAIFIGTLGGGGDDEAGAFEGPAAGQSDYGMTVGDPEAPHQLIVYEDFLCPACGAFEQATNEDLEALAESGDVYIDYRPFVLLSQFGDYSGRAAQAFGVVLEESGPEVAKEFHDLLFANQPEEGSESYPDSAALIDLAVEAGADEAAVTPGIEAGEGDFSEGGTEEAQDSGVSSTPTLVVDGEFFEVQQSWEELLTELRS